MNQDTANTLFEAGAIFMFLDVPPNTEFGIDYTSWRTGPRFKGIKMIPPGIHFIHYRVADKQGNLGIRSGFFYHFKAKEIVVRKWNMQNEAIDDECVSESDLENISQNRKDIDRFLGAYPYEEFKRWVSLTNKIKLQMLTKLLPLNGVITSASELIGQSFKSSRDKTKEKMETEPIGSHLNEILKVPESLADAESRLPKMSEVENTIIRFSNLDKEQYPKGSNAAQVSLHFIDKSYTLEQLVKEDHDNDYENTLGELQFAFVCFLVGHVYEGFEQWKRLFDLICNCENAIENHPEFFIDFIQVIYFQLKEMPEDFFIDIISKNNFLTICLHNFFDNIKSVNDTYSAMQADITEVDQNKSNAMKRLNEKGSQFKIYLKEHFDFDFEEEPDEYAPVICNE